MSEERSDSEATEERGATDELRVAEERSGGPFGGLSASEAAIRSHEARRQKNAAREADADFARLAVIQRVSTRLAASLDRPALDAIFQILKDKAKAGDLRASAELRQWVTLSQGDDEPEPPEGGGWDELTPAQRAAVRARLAVALLEEPVPDSPPVSAAE